MSSSYVAKSRKKPKKKGQRTHVRSSSSKSQISSSAHAFPQQDLLGDIDEKKELEYIAAQGRRSSLPGFGYTRAKVPKPSTVNKEDLDDPTSVEEITPEKIDEFGELFNLVDDDEGGSIDADELNVLLKMTMGKMLPSDAEIAMIYNEIDSDGGGSIEFDEFVSFMTEGVVSSFKRNTLTKAFTTLELPQEPGQLHFSELEKVLLAYLPDKLKTPEDVRKLVGHLDWGDQGKIDYSALMNKYIS